MTRRSQLFWELIGIALGIALLKEMMHKRGTALGLSSLELLLIGMGSAFAAPYLISALKQARSRLALQE